MNRKKLIGVAGSLLIAVFGTVVLVSYVNSKTKTEATRPEAASPVLVVAQSVKAGTAAEALGSAVAVKSVPVSAVVPGAVTQVDDLKDLVAAVDLVPGEQVLRSRFTTAQERSRGDVPPELLTVTLGFSPERALGGRISPGYKVAVIGSFKKEDPFPAQAKVLMHQVLVTAVQAAQRVNDQEVQGQLPEGALLITFAVDVAGAERLAYAHQNGTLWLANEPAEAPTAGSQVITRENVYP